MRRDFRPLLFDHMRRDERIWVVTPDLGYGFFDQIAAEFPARFVNVGAAEVAAMGVAVGLADDGKIPVVYSITPFLLKRPFEVIDNYLEHEGANVKLCGGGRDKCYSHDGYSHDATNAKQILSCWPHIKQFWPETVADLSAATQEWLYHDGPAFLSLRR